MRICYLASARSIHTIRWINHFASQGHDIQLVSFDQAQDLDDRVVIHRLVRRWPLHFDCFYSASYVREILKKFDVDILHAHYASSYGTLGRLCRFHPYVLSVWGSDVYEFPKRSWIHRELLKANLFSADTICSTSGVMASEINKYCDRPIAITPFGIDCEQFCPSLYRERKCEEFVVGTVKTLEPVYGIEYLIRAFAILVAKYQGNTRLKLVIAGAGYLDTSLKKMAFDLGIGNVTEFLGAIPHRDVPKVLGQLSVFAMLSNSESFGVAALEASACGLPVIATNVGNLPEIVRHKITGIIVPARNPAATAEALLALLDDERMREGLGKAGREFVQNNYEWDLNAARMENVYERVLSA